MNQPNQEPNPTKPKNNLKLLLIILAAVIVIGGGFTWWYVKGNKSNISPTISPTPTKSLSVSPTASGSASNKTSTPSNGSETATPTAETQAFSGKLGFKDPDASTDLSCVPTVSFQYPKDYKITVQKGTPSVSGYTTWLVYKDLNSSDAEKVYIGNISYEAGTYDSPSKCVSPEYSSLADYASRNNISNYSPLTINDLSAIQYEHSGQKITAVQNTNKIVINIVHSNGTDTTAYETIVDSIKF